MVQGALLKHCSDRWPQDPAPHSACGMRPQPSMFVLYDVAVVQSQQHCAGSLISDLIICRGATSATCTLLVYAQHCSCSSAGTFWVNSTGSCLVTAACHHHCLQPGAARLHNAANNWHCLSAVQARAAQSLCMLPCVCCLMQTSN